MLLFLVWLRLVRERERESEREREREREIAAGQEVRVLIFNVQLHENQIFVTRLFIRDKVQP